jgi:tRNA threonylcarbamoyladenosine biosynthesis protein TsaB
LLQDAVLSLCASEDSESQPLKILSIDSSTTAGSILLAEDEKIVAEINVDSDQTHSARLLPGIDYLLKSTGLELADVEAFAVICGPGSFTGIRIGITTIKGLAETTSKPVIPIMAFEAWVTKYPTRQGVIVPMIDARRNEVYAAVFERTDEEVTQLSAGMVDKPAHILPRLKPATTLFVGGGSARYRELILGNDHSGWDVATSDPFLGRPMARLAFQRFRQGQFTTARELQAYYLRKSDAEILWKEK